MKPRTKEERRLSEYVDGFRPISAEELAYGRENCFCDNAIESRNTIYCTRCGHKWSVKDGQHTDTCQCPNCQKNLNVRHHTTVYKENDYFSISHVCGEYQVFRFFIMKKIMKKSKIDFFEQEVGCIFFDENGKRTEFSLNRNPMCYYFDAWCFNSSISLKHNGVMSRLPIGSLLTYDMIPTLQRNGWDGKLLDYDIEVVCRLLSDQRYESLYKIGHIDVLRHWTRFGCNDKYLRLLKIASRHKHIFSEPHSWGDFLDYIKDLETIGKDIYNPQIIFPTNFMEEHIKVHEKAERVREQRERERQERARQERIEKDKAKKKLAKRNAKIFADFKIDEGSVTARPLLTLTDYKSEGKALHHCVATYYGKPDTLILTIDYNGEKAETAEIDLQNYSIVQCRGLCNRPSDNHDYIVSVLKNHMDGIKRFYQQKTNKKQQRA